MMSPHGLQDDHHQKRTGLIRQATVKAETIEKIRFANANVAIIREEQIRQSLSIEEAMLDLRGALSAVARQQAVNRPRVRISIKGGDPAWLHTLRGGIASWHIAGGKDYTSIKYKTPAMWATVVDTRDGLPLAFIEADYLSRMRTAATTAVATDLLAPADVTCLAHFGVGKISELLVRGVLKVRPSIRTIRIVRSEDSTSVPPWLEQFDGDLEVLLSDRRSALLEADVVTTATSSREPVILAGTAMPRLRHMNLIGSNHLKRREIPEEVARKCLPPEGYLVADDPTQAALEAGDFAALAAKGELDWSKVPSLAQLLDDPAEKEKSSRAKLTAFKSVGIGLMDLAISAGILRRMGLLDVATGDLKQADQEE